MSGHCALNVRPLCILLSIVLLPSLELVLTIEICILCFASPLTIYVNVWMCVQPMRDENGDIILLLFHWPVMNLNFCCALRWPVKHGYKICCDIAQCMALECASYAIFGKIHGSTQSKSQIEWQIIAYTIIKWAVVATVLFLERYF